VLKFLPPTEPCWHNINFKTRLPFCHFIILRFCDFAMLRFCDFAILRFCDFAILLFCDFVIARFWFQTGWLKAKKMGLSLTWCYSVDLFCTIFDRNYLSLIKILHFCWEIFLLYPIKKAPKIYRNKTDYSVSKWSRKVST
jgi:hypothetical protein